MDAERFDTVTRALSGSSRRHLVSALTGIAMHGLASLSGLGDVVARHKKKKRKKKKRKNQRPQCNSFAGEEPCGIGCCNSLLGRPCCGNTLCCAEGTFCCGANCCPSGFYCCHTGLCTGSFDEYIACQALP